MIGIDGPIVRKARETRYRNDWSGEEEKEKIKPGYKKKSNGQLMKRGEKLSELKTVRVVGRNERTNVKLSNPFFTCSEENIDFLYELHKENLLGTCLKL